MKNLLINILLCIFEIVILGLYGYIGKIIINYFIPIDFSIQQENVIAIIFGFSYIIIIPISLVIILKIKETLF